MKKPDRSQKSLDEMIKEVNDKAEREGTLLKNDPDKNSMFVTFFRKTPNKKKTTR